MFSPITRFPKTRRGVERLSLTLVTIYSFSFLFTVEMLRNPCRRLDHFDQVSELVHHCDTERANQKVFDEKRNESRVNLDLGSHRNRIKGRLCLRIQKCRNASLHNAQTPANVVVHCQPTSIQHCESNRVAHATSPFVQFPSHR